MKVTNTTALFLPEQPFHLLGDMEVEDYDKAEEPPIVSEPDYPQKVEKGPESHPCPFVMVKILPAHHSLFYRIDDCFKCLWVIHGKVCENLTVQTDILLSKLAHKLRI